MQSKLHHFVETLVAQSEGSILFDETFDESRNPVDVWIGWLTCLNTSVVRAFRHTGTFLGLLPSPPTNLSVGGHPHTLALRYPFSRAAVYSAGALGRAIRRTGHHNQGLWTLTNSQCAEAPQPRTLSRCRPSGGLGSSTGEWHPHLPERCQQARRAALRNY